MSFDERSGEITPNRSHGLELAGALQSLMHDLRNRDYILDIQQEEAVKALGSSLLNGKTSGYVEMATGTGKTAIEALFAEAAAKSGKRVLLLAPTIAIADQLSGKDGDELSGIAKFTDLHQKFEIGHHYDGHKAGVDHQVVISTYGGLLADARSTSPRLGNFDVIIADECHRSLGLNTSEMLRTNFKDTIKVGFSATPDFAVDRKSEEVFDDKIFEFSLLEAVESGKTAPLRTLLYETDESLELFDGRKDFTEKELAPLIYNQSRNGTAYQLATDLVRDGRQGVIACIPGDGNVHARLMAAILSKQDDILAMDIGSHLSSEENKARLDAFRAGVVDVLTFTKALEEGWDSDRASFALNMAPTTSPVRTKQLLGRISRQKASGLDSIYVDFVDKSRGISKNQYTAFHALEIEHIDITRVLGVTHTGGSSNATVSQLPNFSSEVYQRLARSNGRLVKDVLTVAKRDTIDPLVRQWENILKKEGMPEELSENYIVDTIPPSYFAKAIKSFKTRMGYRPSEIETTQEIINDRTNPDYIRRALAFYGLREDMDDNLEHQIVMMASDDVSIEEAIASEELNPTIEKILKDLSGREAGVVSMRFGIGEYTDPATLDQIAEAFGVTRERIRQIESKTMAKLRHPSRSYPLRSFIETFDERGYIDLTTSDKAILVQNLIKRIEVKLHTTTGDPSEIDTLRSITKSGAFAKRESLEIDQEVIRTMSPDNVRMLLDLLGLPNWFKIHSLREAIQQDKPLGRNRAAIIEAQEIIDSYSTRREILTKFYTTMKNGVVLYKIRIDTLKRHHLSEGSIHDYERKVDLLTKGLNAVTVLQAYYS